MKKLKCDASKYQMNWSQENAESTLDFARRRKKAKKIAVILADYLGDDLDSLSLLDVGCSRGIVAHYLSRYFGNTIGVDIDNRAIEWARRKYKDSNVRFDVQDSLNLDFNDNSFDVCVCNQVYEHVPEPQIMIAEIFRVLRTGGVCYLAAGNRFAFWENHYKLPLLSVIPKPLAHGYLRIFGRGYYYYENHMTVWELRRLVKDFERIDYTLRIIVDPEKYSAEDMVKPGTLKQKLGQFIVRFAYWLCPTYVWLLRKPSDGN